MLARESADDPSLAAPYPLGLLSAATQGMIGVLLQQALRDAGLRRPTATLITRTVIADEDRDGAAVKFIGAVYDRRRAHELAAAHAWRIAQDGEGWRRVVPSPRPRRVVELEIGRLLVDAGTTVIMGGGGGVPVAELPGGLTIVDAVIDKDRTAALIARALGADLLAILTDVPGVISDFGTEDAAVLSVLTPALARTLDLPEGSMGAKVDAACDFAETTGRPAVIGPLEHAEDVVSGILGTRIAVTGDQDRDFRPAPSGDHTIG